MPQTQKSINVLCIEDNPGDFRLIREQLRRVDDESFSIENAKRLDEGLKKAAAGRVDVVLLDLFLPDSQGLDTFLRFFKAQPDTPIIILSGREDNPLAVHTLQVGAQDYLVKDRIDGRRLSLAICYGIERNRLRVELKTAYLRLQEEQEKHFADCFPATTVTHITESMFGMGALKEVAANIFQQLSEQYSQLIDMAVEQQIFKTDHKISKSLQEMAEQIGGLKGGPRDVIDIHKVALQKNMNQAEDEKKRLKINESRLLVLELMGHLLVYYKHRSI